MSWRGKLGWVSTLCTAWNQSKYLNGWESKGGGKQDEVGWGECRGMQKEREELQA